MWVDVRWIWGGCEWMWVDMSAYESIWVDTFKVSNYANCTAVTSTMVSYQPPERTSKISDHIYIYNSWEILFTEAKQIPIKHIQHKQFRAPNTFPFRTGKLDLIPGYPHNVPTSGSRRRRFAKSVTGKSSKRNRWLESLPSLKLTAKAPENGCLEDDRFLLGFGLFSELLLLVSEGAYPKKQKRQEAW